MTLSHPSALGVRGIRLLALNVNHRTFHKPMPPALTSALLSHRPDVLVLTEFVERTPRCDLRTALADAGLVHHLTSDRLEYTPRRFTNQVLVATRKPVSRLVPPARAPNPHAEANLLCVEVDGLRLAAVRAPLVRGAGARSWREYWEWLAGHKGVDVMIGDLNFDPEAHGPRNRAASSACRAAGWVFSRPDGLWSYAGASGRRTRIDHVATRPGVRAAGSRYVADKFVPEHTDHAALIAQIEVE